LVINVEEVCDERRREIKGYEKMEIGMYVDECKIEEMK
jgi:hypothetical protein